MYLLRAVRLLVKLNISPRISCYSFVVLGFLFLYNVIVAATYTPAEMRRIRETSTRYRRQSRVSTQWVY